MLNLHHQSYFIPVQVLLGAKCSDSCSWPKSSASQPPPQKKKPRSFSQTLQKMPDPKSKGKNISSAFLWKETSKTVSFFAKKSVTADYWMPELKKRSFKKRFWWMEWEPGITWGSFIGHIFPVRGRWKINHQNHTIFTVRSLRPYIWFHRPGDMLQFDQP